MQLKIRRSQRETGVLSKATLFCLDARVQFTAAESAAITRYKMQKEGIYSSDAAQKAFAKSNDVADGSMMGGFKSLAHAAMGAMRLNITVGSLSQGQHIECKSLDELLGAEEAIMTACRNLRVYLDTAATFDGREVLFDFSKGDAEPIASSATPQPALIAPPVESYLDVSDSQPQITDYSETVPESEPAPYWRPSKNAVIGFFVVMAIGLIYDFWPGTHSTARNTVDFVSEQLHGQPNVQTATDDYTLAEYEGWIDAQTPPEYKGEVWLIDRKVFLSQQDAQKYGVCNNHHVLVGYDARNAFICEP